MSMIAYCQLPLCLIRLVRDPRRDPPRKEDSGAKVIPFCFPAKFPGQKILPRRHSLQGRPPKLAGCRAAALTPQDACKKQVIAFAVTKVHLFYSPTSLLKTFFRQIDSETTRQKQPYNNGRARDEQPKVFSFREKNETVGGRISPRAGRFFSLLDKPCFDGIQLKYPQTTCPQKKSPPVASF